MEQKVCKYKTCQDGKNRYTQQRQVKRPDSRSLELLGYEYIYKGFIFKHFIFHFSDSRNKDIKLLTTQTNG